MGMSTLRKRRDNRKIKFIEEIFLARCEAQRESVESVEDRKTPNLLLSNKTRVDRFIVHLEEKD